MVVQLPSLEKVFSRTQADQHTLTQLKESLGIASVASLMMIPMEDLEGIPFAVTDREVRRVRSLLARWEVPHRRCDESAADFLERAFGRAKDAPIGVLHVMAVPHYADDRAVFAPLQLLKVLEEVLPEATIGDLTSLTRQGIQKLANAAAKKNTALRCRQLPRELVRLEFRLREIDLVLPAQPTRS